MWWGENGRLHSWSVLEETTVIEKGRIWVMLTRAMGGEQEREAFAGAVIISRWLGGWARGRKIFIRLRKV